MKKVIIAVAAYFSYLGYQFIVNATEKVINHTTEIETILNAVQ